MGCWDVVRPREPRCLPASGCAFIALLLGCGRIGFDTGSSIDAPGDGGPDTSIDAPLAFGPWLTPTEVAVMNTTSMDFGPTFSPDASEVYVSQRFTGDAEIFRFTRADAASAFGNKTAIAAINVSGGSEEGEPSLSDDGLELWFNRYAPDRIFVSTRSSVTVTDWTAPVLVDTIHPNLAGFHSPDFSADRHMVLTKDGMIWEATRPSSTSPWGAPVSLGITGDVPCMRRDGLELLYEGAVTIAGMPSVAIMRRTRASIGVAFGPEERLSFGALDVAGVGDPELSHDGSTLIFSAEEVLGNVTYDIYISERVIE